MAGSGDEREASRGVAAWRRGLVAFVAVLAMMVTAVAATVGYFASHLERVVGNARLQRVLAERHVSVSLERGSVGLGRLELGGLRVRITKARKNAPVTTLELPLLRVDYALGALLFSSRKSVGAVRVDGLSIDAMRYVRDDDDPAKGTDDADDDDDADEPLELAKVLATLGRAPVTLGTFELSALTFTSELRSLTTGKVTRTTVAPLAARASLREGTLELRVGEPSAPLETSVTRSVDTEPPRTAKLASSIALTVAPGGLVDASATVDLLAQDLDRRLPAKARMLAATLHASTAEAEQEVRLERFDVELLGGLVHVEATGTHRDTANGSAVTLPSAQLRLHVERLPELLAESLASRVTLTEARPLVLAAKNLRAGAAGGLAEDTSIALEGGVRELALHTGDEDLVVRGLEATGAITFSKTGSPNGRLALNVGRLTAPGGVSAEDGVVALTAEPATAATAPKKGATPVTLAFRASLARAKSAGAAIAGLEATVDAGLVGSEVSRPSLRATVASIAAVGGRAEALEIDGRGPASVRFGTKEPFDTTATLVLRARTAEAPSVRVSGGELAVTTQGNSVATTFAARGKAESLSIAGTEGRRATTPFAFAVTSTGPMNLVVPKPVVPRVHGHAEAFGAVAKLDALAQGRGAEVEAELDVPSLASIAPLVPTRGVTLCATALPRASLRAALKGFASANQVPAGRLKFEGVELCNAPVAAKANTVDLRWPALHPATSVALEGSVSGLALAGDGLERSASFALRAERRGPRSGTVKVDLTGVRIPEVHLAADATFTARDRRLAFTVDAHAAHVEALPPALRASGATGLDALATLSVATRGEAVGLIDRWDDAGLALAPSAFTASTGQLALRASLEGLRAHGERGAKAAMERVALEASVAKTGRSLAVRSTVSGNGLEAESTAGGARLQGLEASVDVASPDGEKIDAHARLTVADAELRGKQHVALGKVALAVDAQGSRSEAIGISRLEIASSGLGTSFEASGSVDLRPRTAPVGFGDVVVVGRESAYLRGVLVADLGALTASVEGLGAKGRVRAPLVLAAGDRSLVRVDGSVEFENVSVDWGAGRVEGVDGLVPVDEELRFDGNRVRLVPLAANAFSRERFEDQQPLVSGASFVRVKRIALGDEIAGPLGASVRVERNTIAVERLELTALGGAVGGRLFVDLRGRDTRVDFRGDVTGLAVAADKKPLDAHMAIRLKPWRRALEGRVDVARTSPDQLRLMLDVYDPYQENVSANRARQALVLGYPKSVRMRFQDGLAAVAIDLGGLGSAVRIDEIRGVPIAPMLEKSLLPKLPKEPPSP